MQLMQRFRKEAACCVCPTVLLFACVFWVVVLHSHTKCMCVLRSLLLPHYTWWLLLYRITQSSSFCDGEKPMQVRGCVAALFGLPGPCVMSRHTSTCRLLSCLGRFQKPPSVGALCVVYWRLCSIIHSCWRPHKQPSHKRGAISDDTRLAGMLWAFHMHIYVGCRMVCL